jgi:hypothetical protein
MTSDTADPRLVKLVRELDAQRQELVRERRRCNALQALNAKLQARLLAERQQKQEARAAPPPA